ncbi:MAG: hypothetical protein GDA41_11835 [Rhodospirillales bacterium]|nr:hypothetical protein [Rhodospirillales bacterium]
MAKPTQSPVAKELRRRSLGIGGLRRICGRRGNFLPACDGISDAGIEVLALAYHLEDLKTADATWVRCHLLPLAGGACDPELKPAGRTALGSVPKPVKTLKPL